MKLVGEIFGVEDAVVKEVVDDLVKEKGLNHCLEAT